MLGTPATTEQLRQWILASRKGLPEAASGDTLETDLAGTILRSVFSELLEASRRWSCSACQLFSCLHTLI